MTTPFLEMWLVDFRGRGETRAQVVARKRRHTLGLGKVRPDTLHPGPNSGDVPVLTIESEAALRVVPGKT